MTVPGPPIGPCGGIEDEHGRIDGICATCQRLATQRIDLQVWLRAPLEQPCGMYLPADSEPASWPGCSPTGA